MSYTRKKEDDMVRLGLATHQQIDDAVDQADFGTLYRLANLDYDKDGDEHEERYVVAGPGNSPHITGYAFDLSGGSLGAIDAAIAKAASGSPDFKDMFKDTIVESGNNCVHVDVDH